MSAEHLGQPSLASCVSGVGMNEKWRVGSKVNLNVYEGSPGRPICQCHTPEDAARIVEAVNALPDSKADPFSELFGSPVAEKTRLHEHKVVAGNKYCGECGAGRLHPIHIPPQRTQVGLVEQDGPWDIK